MLIAQRVFQYMQMIRSDALSNFDMFMLVFGPKAQVHCRIFPAQHGCHRVIWVCSKQRCSRRLPLPPLPLALARARPRPRPPARAHSLKLVASAAEHGSRALRRALLFPPFFFNRRAHVHTHKHTEVPDAGPRRRRGLQRRRRPRRHGSQMGRAGSGACCLRPAAPGS